jgi:hypothetical protein
VERAWALGVEAAQTQAQAAVRGSGEALARARRRRMLKGAEKTRALSRCANSGAQCRAIGVMRGDEAGSGSAGRRGKGRRGPLPA